MELSAVTCGPLNGLPQLARTRLSSSSRQRYQQHSSLLNPSQSTFGALQHQIASRRKAGVAITAEFQRGTSKTKKRTEGPPGLPPINKNRGGGGGGGGFEKLVKGLLLNAAFLGGYFVLAYDGGGGGGGGFDGGSGGGGGGGGDGGGGGGGGNSGAGPNQPQGPLVTERELDSEDDEEDEQLYASRRRSPQRRR